MRILGLHAAGHDAGACLIDDGSITAIAEERLSRRKSDGSFPWRAIEHLLRGASLESVDLVVVDVSDRQAASARRVLESRGFRGEIAFVSHHLAHAASAHFVAPEDGAAILVVDAAGTHVSEWPPDVPRPRTLPEDSRLGHEVQSFYVARGRAIETLHQTFTRPGHRLGLGWLWAVTTVYLGFGELDAGKTMGLAAHAPASREDDVLGWDAPGGDLLFPVDLDPSDESTWDAYRDQLFGGLARRAPGDPLEARHAEVAARLQRTTERFLLRLAEQLYTATEAQTLCFSGGVALNVIANRRLREASPFERVVVQPAASDTGVALGCALLGAIQRDIALPAAPELSCFAPPMDRAATEEALRRASAQGLVVTRPTDLLGDVVERLCAGAIVGWMDGASELGPRGLGHRSLLADPRDAASKERINERVKRRETFRPFAPAVLEEHADEWFDLAFASPNMLFAASVRPDRREAVPAITHIDGSARVQTVGASYPGRLRLLLERFAGRTGVPMLLNTSLNGPGEPIVESAADGVRLLLGSRMDALVIEDAVVSRT